MGQNDNQPGPRRPPTPVAAAASDAAATLRVVRGLVRAASAPLVLLWGRAGHCYGNAASSALLASAPGELDAGRPAAVLWPAGAAALEAALAAAFAGAVELAPVDLPLLAAGTGSWPPAAGGGAGAGAGQEDSAGAGAGQDAAGAGAGQDAAGAGAGQDPAGVSAAHVRCAVAPVYDGAGRVAGALLSLGAAAAHTAVHAALARSEQRFAALTDNLPQLVWTCLPDGQCHYLSPQWQQYSGQSLHALLGLGWVAELLHPEDRDRTSAHWMGAVHDHNPYAIAFRLRRHDGVYRWFMARGVPVRDAGGRITYWFGTCTDIEEQKSVEAALQEALRARDQFVSVASHELKTPMTSLLLLTQRLRRGMARDGGMPAARILHIAEHSCHQVARLNSLVDDMLDATRIRAGKLELARRHLALVDLAAAVLERLAPLFADAQRAVPTLRVDARPCGEWDAGRVEQVLTNLLTNALRYGAGRPVELRVWQDGAVAVAAVRDHGVGIAPAHQAMIFRRFERATAASEVSGLGLGLFISQEIAHAHGGEVALESAVGAGSTFSLRLPLAGATAPA